MSVASDLSFDDWGVRRAHVYVPYLRRQAEQRLVADVGAGRPVVVVGAAMSGKTRMCAEVLRRSFPQWPVLFPDPTSGVAALLTSCADVAQAVLWLDDLDRFLGWPGLTAPQMAEAQRRGWLVMATMRSSAYQTVESTLPNLGNARAPGAAAITPFNVLRLDNDQSERVRLASAVADPYIQAGIRRHGLGEYLAAGWLAVQRYQAGLPSNRLGAAMVAAAIDCDRAGLQGAPLATLLEGAAAYLPPAVLGGSYDQDDLQEALEWATAPVDDVIALLEPIGALLRAQDYLTDYLRHREPSIPGLVWTAVAANCPPSRAGTVACTAYTAGRADIAEPLWLRAANDGDPEAMNSLGLLLDTRGYVTQAEAWYRRAVAAGHPDAATNLWVVLHQREVERAAEALQQGSGYSVALAVLLHRSGDLAEAEVRYREAINTGNDNAMSNLAVLLEDRDEVNEAEVWWRRAVDKDVGGARTNLAALLFDRGDLDEAETLWRTAANSGDSDAAYNLGLLLHDRGDFHGAEALWRFAASCGDPYAQHNLQILLERTPGPVAPEPNEPASHPERDAP